MNSEQFVDLSAQSEAIKKIIPAKTNRNLIKANFTHISGSEKQNPEVHNSKEPKIELQKDGDFIEMIKVICTCGEVIQIVLDYDNANIESEDESIKIQNKQDDINN